MTEKEVYQWPIEPKYMVIEHDYYGLRQIHQILKRPRFHSGFDITAHTLTPVRPASRGIVKYADVDYKILSGDSPWNHRYGNMIIIYDEYGRKCIYGHLREIKVKVGDVVDYNSIIGLTGCSGGARIPHLHFEIRKTYNSHSGEENTINPLDVLPCRDLNALDMDFDEEPYAEIWKMCRYDSWSCTDENIPYSNDKKLIR